MNFNASLLRERFEIIDNRDVDAQSVSAQSNRMVVPLRDRNDQIIETFVLRGQTMHYCIRMAVRILQTFQKQGPILSRSIAFDWREAWESIQDDYDRMFHPERWIAVYNKGKPLFQSGDHHMFLDIIEQCDAHNKDDYDKSVTLAEDAFRKLGKDVTIKHQANVALVVDVSSKEGRAGIIQRSPARTTTFRFVATDGKESDVTPQKVVGLAANFLEGMQLSFLIGLANEKTRMELITSKDPENKRAYEARRRLRRLNMSISSLEQELYIRYRPEKPEFGDIIEDSERHANKMFAPDDEELDEDASLGDDETAPENKSDGQSSEKNKAEHGTSGAARYNATDDADQT